MNLMISIPEIASLEINMSWMSHLNLLASISSLKRERGREREREIREVEIRGGGGDGRGVDNKYIKCKDTEDTRWKELGDLL